MFVFIHFSNGQLVFFSSSFSLDIPFEHPEPQSLPKMHNRLHFLTILIEMIPGIKKKKKNLVYIKQKAAENKKIKAVRRGKRSTNTLCLNFNYDGNNLPQNCEDFLLIFFLFLSRKMKSQNGELIPEPPSDLDHFKIKKYRLELEACRVPPGCLEVELLGCGGAM